MLMNNKYGTTSKSKITLIQPQGNRWVLLPLARCRHSWNNYQEGEQKNGEGQVLTLYGISSNCYGAAARHPEAVTRGIHGAHRNSSQTRSMVWEADERRRGVSPAAWWRANVATTWE
jgi:hypothetical protein